MTDKTTEQAEAQPTYRPIETLKIALYGEWSTGKTEQIRWLGKTVGLENLMIVSAEGGLSTIKSVIEQRPQMVVRVNCLGDVAIDAARAAKLAEKAIAEGLPISLRQAWPIIRAFATGNNRWIAVDGGSEIMSWIANEQISNTETLYDLKSVSADIPDRLKPYGRFLGNNGSIQVPQIYGRIGRDIENLLAAWTALPCNLLWNFLEDMTGSTGFEKCKPFGPHIPGKVGLRAVMGSFDFVGRMMVKQGKSVVGFRTTAEYLARVRADWEAGIKITAEIEEFRLDKFVGLLTNGNNQPTEAKASKS